MNPDNKIEQELTNLGQQLGAHGSMKHSVLEQINREGAAPPVPHRGLRINWSISLGSALAASVLIVLFFHLGSEKSISSGSLYAQAIEAMQSAKSVHITVKEVADDAPPGVPEADKSRVVFETFYERGAGWREENNFNYGSTHITVDDTQHRWDYSPKATDVLRKKSEDSIASSVRKILNPDKMLEGGRRDPTGDLNVDREQLQLYVFEQKDNDFIERNRVWVDSNRRVRRVDEMRTSDNVADYREHMIGEVVYDVPIDHKLFVPDFPPQARVVDVDEIVEKNFSLDKALYKQEMLGIIFAVHRVEQINNGELAVLTSIRPTDETRRLVGPVDESLVYNFARYNLNDSENRTKHYKYDVHELTLLYENGLIAKWHVVSSTGWFPDELKNQFMPSFSIIAQGAWESYLTKAGKQTWTQASPDVKIPAPKQQIKLADLMKEVYSQTTPLVQIPLKPRPMSDEQMQPLWDKGVVPRDVRLFKSSGTANAESFKLEGFQKEIAERLRWPSNPPL